MRNQEGIYRTFRLISLLKARPAKTIKSLSKMLGISERSVYRYIDLLRDLGFTLIKERGGAFHLPESNSADQVPFTAQEITFLKKLLLTTGKQNKLVKSIIPKIEGASEAGSNAELIYNTHISALVEKLSQAIADRKQVILKSYCSLNSETISDRLIEPTCFTDGYRTVSAYEVKTKSNKYFNIERIGDVEITGTPMRNEKKHAFYKPDIFGFQGKDLDKEVEWTMSLLACQLLKEEFPVSSLSINPLPEGGRFHFKASVQNFEAPGRFVMGMGSHVTVTGSKAFLEYLKKRSYKRR